MALQGEKRPDEQKLACHGTFNDLMRKMGRYIKSTQSDNNCAYD